MTADVAAELCAAAMMLALSLGAPVLLAALATGLIVGLLQAVTQLHDPTINFIPKLIVISVVIMLLLPWGLSQLTEYATHLIQAIPGTI